MVDDPVVPRRQIRARYTPTTLTVYQAYSSAIADAALATGRFVPPFKRDRMTWIKPSFLWMAYRSGWATKADQERVLAIEIARTGFEWALAHASLSHYEPGTYPDRSSWAAAKQVSPVRVQWDPERDLALQPMDHRAIQVGLSGEAVDRFIDEWTSTITDITDLVRQVGDHVRSDQLDAARQLLPDERPYPLPASLAPTIGAS